MKISTLSKREDYKLIIYNTLLKFLENQFIETENIEFTKYYVNKRLSIIFSNDISNDFFYKSVVEYRYNNNILKRTIQFFYVNLFSIKFIRKLFSDDIIYLPKYFSSFSIIGGNHRIRLLDVVKSQFLVLLKNGELSHFIENELKVRSLPEINYLPSIKHDLNNNWFYESYEFGIPFNRLNLNNEKKIEYFNHLFQSHNSKLIQPSIEKIDINIYLQLIQTEIINILKKGKYAEDILPITYQLFSKLEIYFFNSNFDILTAYTHGDFQEGNLRIQNNKIIVIDWESSDRRFFFYDFFVLLGNSRHYKHLLKSYFTFKEKIRFLNDYPSEVLNENSMLLFFLEELRFYIYEENSINYNTPPKRCRDIIVQFISIISLLNFTKNHES